MAADVEGIVDDIGPDSQTKGIVLNSLAFARFANCEFDAALRIIDAILALSDDAPLVELAPARALRGVIEICLATQPGAGGTYAREPTKHASYTLSTTR